MTLLQPTYLWALLSLAVPLVIHLLNKGDVRTVKVGSVKYLREFDTKQSRKIRLNELLLLFLRILILGLLVIYLAEPRWEKDTEKTRIAYLIDPLLAKEESFLSFMNGLTIENPRWFSKGFPEYEAEIDEPGTPNYWQLAQQLGEVSSDSIVVFAKGMVEGVKGPRPKIPQNVDWVVIDNEQKVDTYIAAKKFGDSVRLFKVKGNSQLTDLQTTTLSQNDRRIVTTKQDSLELEEADETFKIPFLKEDTLNVTIAFDKKYEREMQYLSASLKAIGQYGMQEIQVEKVEDNAEFEQGKPRDLLIWLKEAPVPNIGSATIAVAQDSLANELIEETTTKNNFHLTERLTIQNTVAESLTNTLAKLLLSSDSLNQKVKEYDHRVIPEAELATNFSTEKVDRKDIRYMDISPWLWLALVVVLVAERILSKLRKQ